MSANHSSLEHLKPQSPVLLSLSQSFVIALLTQPPGDVAFVSSPPFPGRCWCLHGCARGAGWALYQYWVPLVSYLSTIWGSNKRECNVVLATRRLPISLKNWKRTVPFPFDLLLSLTLQTSTSVFHLHTLSGQKGLKVA